MRAFVFTDPVLGRQSGRFVWLAINTERAANAPFRERFPIAALPTFLIVDPATEKVALRWVGGATVPQLEKILDEGRMAVKRGAAPEGRAEDAQSALARADRLYGEADYAGAASAYQEALAAAPQGWPSYARTVESVLFAMQQTGNDERVAQIARDAYPRLARTPSAA